VQAMSQEAAPGPLPLPHPRAAGLVALLLAEVLVLSARFDPIGLGRTRGWWSEVLHRVPSLTRLGLAVAAAGLLFAGGRLRAELKKAPRGGAPPAAGPLLLAHFAGLAGLVWVSAQVLDGPVRDLASPGLWAAAWWLLAAVTLGCWAAAAVPFGLWLPLA